MGPAGEKDRAYRQECAGGIDWQHNKIARRFATQKAIDLVDGMLKTLEVEGPSHAVPLAALAVTAKVATDTDAAAPRSTAAAVEESVGAGKRATRKKEKKAAATASKPPSAPEVDVFGQADLRVGLFTSVEPVVGSEKLWLCQVDVGEAAPRQLVAGLQQYISKERMQGLRAVVVCNLKPAKLAGHISEAMVLAATVEDGNTVLVQTLDPPEGARPGEKVSCDVVPAGEEPAKVLKTKVWQAVQAELTSLGGYPAYKRHVLHTAAGDCTLFGCSDGAKIR